MIRTIFVNISLLFFCLATHAQYISSINYPDTTVIQLTAEDSIALKYAETITAEDLSEHLSILASDEYEGRETGEIGNDKASSYIAKQFKEMNLEAKGTKNSYYQTVAFSFSRWVDTDIFVNGKRFKHLWDYLSFPNKNADVPFTEADEVIYLGYGIDDPAYSDYKKKKVEGKVILINKGEPFNYKKDSTSWITKTKEPSEWTTDITKKLKAAKKHGVKTVLIIEDDIKKMLTENRRMLLGYVTELGDKSEEEIPYANHCYISTTIAKELIGDKQKKVIKARKKSNEKGKNSDVKLKSKFVLNQKKEIKVLNGRNVIGVIEGSDKKEEYVIIVAHYDHLGKRGDDVYNGADDNGSGTSAVIEIAEAFAKAKNEGNGPRRSVVCLLVTGEEKGLLGSQYYTSNPIFPLDSTSAVVNIDMIGRSDEKYTVDSSNHVIDSSGYVVDSSDYIYVIGSDRLSTELHSINEEQNQKYERLVLDYTFNSESDPNRYYFRSDHYNFAKEGIPSIFFFSGVHQDYHRPSDTVEKIDFDKTSKRGRHIFYTAWELANREEMLAVDGEIK